jgi:murein L,D-transpeptidase YcbB/YkuD
MLTRPLARRLLRGGALFCLLSVLTAAPSRADLPADGAVAEDVRDLVVSGAQAGLHGLPADTHRGALKRFYEERQYQPAWLANGHPTARAQEAVSLLGRADEKGLSSADYEAPLLAQQLIALRVGPPASAHELARFDVFLTLALLSYTENLGHGRVNPRSVYLDLDSGKRRVDSVALLQAGLKSDRLTAEIEAAEPKLPIYSALKKSLGEYRRLAAGKPLPLVPTPKAKVEPGGTLAGLPELKRRLVAFGDLDPAALSHDGESGYAGEVVEAVKRFQYRHGLTQDGVLGAATVSELNRAPAERVRQIEMGLERIRWLPPVPPGRFLVINIPEFKLLSFDGSIGVDRPLLEMDVIVGRAGRTPTPVFADQIEYLDFSPHWNVPRSIARNELLPKLRKDPGYLARQGMEFVGTGVSSTVNEAALADLERGALRLRQRPGAKNALGGVKFMFPNRYDVYLHGTPAQELFSRTRRDFSHGCIRAENPTALAQFVLYDRPDWDVDRIRASLALAQPIRVTLKQPMPILIFYTTAVVDAQGRTRFLPDIYGHDRALADAIRRSVGAPRPAGGASLPGAHATRVDVDEARARIKTHAA